MNKQENISEFQCIYCIHTAIRLSNFAFLETISPGSVLFARKKNTFYASVKINSLDIGCSRLEMKEKGSQNGEGRALFIGVNA